MTCRCNLTETMQFVLDLLGAGLRRFSAPLKIKKNSYWGRIWPTGVHSVLLCSTSGSVRLHTVVLLLFWNLSGTTRVSRYQKGKNQEGKTNLDLVEQEIVSGSGICWAMQVCTSSQITMPTSHHSVFLYKLDALPAAQPTASKHWSRSVCCYAALMDQ